MSARSQVVWSFANVQEVRSTVNSPKLKTTTTTLQARDQEKLGVGWSRTDQGRSPDQATFRHLYTVSSLIGDRAVQFYIILPLALLSTTAAKSTTKSSNQLASTEVFRSGLVFRC
ncbi:unnamed protein product [Calypogeia fissa]